MEQRIEQFLDFWKSIAPIIVVLWICGVLSFFILESVAPAGRKTEAPEIAFYNVSPCLGFDKDLVEMFEIGDPQYICAEMETDEAQVFLELHIYESEDKNQVYVTGNTFSSGRIAFYIDSLPPGKYVAWIFWARTNLVSVEFEVIENDG